MVSRPPDGPDGPSGGPHGRSTNRPARPRRPLSFRLHAFLGLQLSLFLLFVCVTGTLAVVAHDLEWLYRPEVRGGPDRTGWAQQLDAARAAFPDYRIGYALAGPEPYLTTRFMATDPGGKPRTIHVDAATGRVTGESGRITLQSILRAVHSYLFVPDDWGFYAVTALGPVLAVLTATGLLVYKRFWRGLFRMPRRNRGPRVFWGDLHRLLGVWSLWFLLLMAVTGTWYLGERILYRAGVDLETAATGLSQAALDRLGPAPPETLSLDRLVQIARTAMPDLEITRISFPSRPGQPLALRGHAAAWLVRDRANGLDLDPYSGAILATHRAEAMPALERWVHMADPLHFGDFDGLPSKLVWLLFGAALCVSCASGVVIFARRSQAGPRAQRPAGTAFSPPASDWRVWGRWTWPHLAAVLMVPAAAGLLYWAPLAAPRALPGPAFPETGPPPWTARIAAYAPGPDAGATALYWRVELCAGCFRQVREVALGFGTAHRGPDRYVPLSGYVALAGHHSWPGGAGSAGTRLPLPAAQLGNTHLWLRVTAWDGSRYLHAWPLPAAQ